jgi:hypothetical protein
MKPLIRFKQVRPAAAGFGLLILLKLACFGLLPQAQAQTNTAYGNGALVSLTSGVWNSGFGFEALNHDTAGKNNTATGLRSLFSDTSGSNNTANGVYALYGNINGWYNSAVGAYALANNTEGNYNTANGYAALYRNTADANTATGFAALYHNTTGSVNTANGFVALLFNTTGTNNTALGFEAGNAVSTASNVICIGAGVIGANVSNSCFIGNIHSNVQPVVGTDPDYVTVTSAGRLGRGNISSRRYKHDIEPMDKASEALFALKPVSFRYKKEFDPTQTLAFGLIAEEVAQVYPHLVGRNPEGQPESVRYDQINAMVLNEFLKEHRKVEKLEATAVEQQKAIEALTATLKEQASEIQKVSDQLEVSRTESRVAVVNNQ